MIPTKGTQCTPGKCMRTTISVPSLSCKAVLKFGDQKQGLYFQGKKKSPEMFTPPPPS